VDEVKQFVDPQVGQLELMRDTPRDQEVANLPSFIHWQPIRENQNRRLADFGKEGARTVFPPSLARVRTTCRRDGIKADFRPKANGALPEPGSEPVRGRKFVPGGTYFFTVNLAERESREAFRIGVI
jgi:hypothetical protein